MSAIEICDLSLAYNSGKTSFLALDNISAVIKSGEFAAIVGSSGCGKSTLLSVLAGLNRPSSGCVVIDGVPVTGTGTERAVVFQQYTLFPWMSAKENVAFGVKQIKSGVSKKQADAVSQEFLHKVGLADFMHKLPGELSGGMQQRVAIARALAVDPKILLMDEPFGAIDARTRVSLQELLLDLWSQDETKKTVVFVTHDIDEALLLSDRIFFMEPKRIKAVVDVAIPRPRSKETLYTQAGANALRNRLMGMFYQDVAEHIGNDEVVI
jgi:NitT/TauT family transport system ATP-binding protein